MAVQLKRVIIIGGGIAGLCTAVGLHNAGLEVSVYEKTPVFADLGAGLTLWANAVKAFRTLGFGKELAAEERFPGGEICSWQGAVLYRSSVKALEQKLGAPSVAVIRSDLHRMLLSALPEQTIQAKKFVGFEKEKKRMAVFFADGSVERADLLIGADGIHSSVRQVLFPTVRLRYAGYAAWRGVVTLRSTMPYRTVEFWGGGTRFGMVPVGGKRIYWYATANVPPGRRLEDKERKIDLGQRFQGWHAPVEWLIEATPANEILYNDIADFDPLPQWSTGAVTLIGDAAHATTPNLGQGACQAVESSVSLVRSLKQENDLGAALARYEVERRSRTAWITTTSRRMGQIGQLENPWLCSLRDALVRLSPPAFFERQVVQAAGYEI